MNPEGAFEVQESSEPITLAIKRKTGTSIAPSEEAQWICDNEDIVTWVQDSQHSGRPVVTPKKNGVVTFYAYDNATTEDLAKCTIKISGMEIDGLPDDEK